MEETKQVMGLGIEFNLNHFLSDPRIKWMGGTDDQPVPSFDTNIEVIEWYMDDTHNEEPHLYIGFTDERTKLTGEVYIPRSMILACGFVDEKILDKYDKGLSK